MRISISNRGFSTFIVSALMTAFAGSAMAANSNVVISESLSSIPENSQITLLDLGSSSKSGFVSGQTIDVGSSETITFTGKSGVYSGSTSGVAAAPWTAAGIDTKNYFAAEPNSSITMNFSSSQKYFGILWGSVDNYNSLSFYNNGTLVTTITGSQISASANGNQTSAGSYFVNVDFKNSAAFNEVVATSSNPAFEFDSIAFAPNSIPITPTDIAAAGNLGTPNIVSASPAPLPLLGASPLAVMILGAAGLKRRHKA